MNDQLEYLKKRVAQGKISRREFMGRASAMGVSAAAATAMMTTAAHAEGPKKGGDLKIGSTGGESTNSLDPATYASQVPGSIIIHTKKCGPYDGDVQCNDGNASPLKLFHDEACEW